MAQGKALAMNDGLVAIEQVIASMKLGPDADQQFLGDLEQVILAKAKQGSQMPQSGQPGQGQAGGAPQSAGPGGAPPQGQPQGGPQPPMPGQPAMGGQQQQSAVGNGAGLMARPDAGGTDPDELRRILLTRAGR